MRTLHVLLCAALTSTAAFCSPGGVLEKVTKIRIDPTVIEQPEKVKDASAANLARYNLRAAFKDAHIEEGDSPIRSHIVLDEFSSESAAKRLLSLNSGRNTSTVDGKLVIQGASGEELASIKIHFHGSVGFSQGQGSNTQRPPTSDFEQRLLQEIERLK